MGERKPYKTDLTEPEWAVITPLIAAWKAKHPSVSGHQGRYEVRAIVNALRYQNRSGCQWVKRAGFRPQRVGRHQLRGDRPMRAEINSVARATAEDWLG